MALKATQVKVWAASIEDRPGGFDLAGLALLPVPQVRGGDCKDWDDVYGDLRAMRGEMGG